MFVYVGVFLSLSLSLFLFLFLFLGFFFNLLLKKIRCAIVYASAYDAFSKAWATMCCDLFSCFIQSPLILFGDADNLFLSAGLSRVFVPTTLFFCLYRCVLFLCHCLAYPLSPSVIHNYPCFSNIIFLSNQNARNLFFRSFLVVFVHVWKWH